MGIEEGSIGLDEMMIWMSARCWIVGEILMSRLWMREARGCSDWMDRAMVVVVVVW